MTNFPTRNVVEIRLEFVSYKRAKSESAVSDTVFLSVSYMQLLAVCLPTSDFEMNFLHSAMYVRLSPCSDKQNDTVRISFQ